MCLALQKHVKEGGAAVYLQIDPSRIPDPRRALLLACFSWPASGDGSQSPLEGAGSDGEDAGSQSWVPGAQCSASLANALPPVGFFPRQPKYVDYMIREFRGKEMMKSQYRLHFQLPMRIIPL